LHALAAALVSAPTDAPAKRGNTVLNTVPETRRSRILLVEDDLVAGEQLASVLPNFGFQVDWRHHPLELPQALEQGQPDMLLMDIVYPDGRDLGVTAVRELREQGRLQCPVIFLSLRDDLDARLQAARTGCDGYLAKPLDIPDLVENLKHFAKQSAQAPFRVLAVEDDRDLLGWYGLVLGEAGFEIEAVSDPARAISTLCEYHPDVILMDIEMPGYSGLDLASVIRQHLEFLQIPIVFITGATNVANRMEAWRSGGDDFIAKPVDPEILIPSLRARAEKSRALVSLSLHQKVKASRERFHVLASVSPVATVYTDPQGLCLFVNPRFTAITGTDAKAAFGKHWTYWVDASERGHIMERWAKAVERQEPFEAELRFRGLDGGAPQWLIGRASPQLGDDGETNGYAATFTDISELKHTSEALSEAKWMLETTFASMQDAVFLLDEEKDEILHVNDAAHNLFGYAIEEIEGAPLSLLFPDDADYQRYRGRLREQIAGFGVFRTDARMRCRDGLHLLAEHTATPLDHGSRQGTLVLVVRDVTEPRALSEKLVYEASHDGLTGLFNRFELERRVDAALGLVQSEDAECVLCYLDLDRFKLINDSCGHHAGDRVLCEVAAVLTAQVRQGDTLARIGGDEFAVLMERCNLDQARRVADSILRAVAAYRLDWEGKRFSVGVSIGMARIGRDSGTISDVLKAVDSACYAAKESGRNRIHVFQHDDIQHLRRHDDAHWGMLIERALEEDRFILFMQPIVSTHGKLQPEEHFEILLRMRGDNGELVCPGDFLASA
jgi:diguanylate cyclase (GGDEF)-like protein/PAS domain S-box-containing protein